MPKMPVTDVVSIYKLQRSGNVETYSSTPAYTNINACIGPTGDDIQTSEGGVYSYQLFEVFIWDITVQINNGDKIVSGVTTYLVTGTPNAYSNRFIQATRTLAKVVV